AIPPSRVIIAFQGNSLPDQTRMFAAKILRLGPRLASRQLFEPAESPYTRPASFPQSAPAENARNLLSTVGCQDFDGAAISRKFLIRSQKSDTVWSGVNRPSPSARSPTQRPSRALYRLISKSGV